MVLITGMKWIFDTAGRLALLAITISFLVSYAYKMIAYALAVQAYSIINPLGIDPQIMGHSVPILNHFHLKGVDAAQQILLVFKDSPWW